MLRETSQSLPKTKLKPERAERRCGLADQPDEEVDEQQPGSRAASAVSPHRRTWSGSRLSGDRSNVERPPRAVVALASTDRALTRSAIRCRSSSPAARCPCQPATPAAARTGAGSSPTQRLLPVTERVGEELLQPAGHRLSSRRRPCTDPCRRSGTSARRSGRRPGSAS